MGLLPEVLQLPELSLDLPLDVERLLPLAGPALVAGNVVTAALAVVWLASASGFSTAGTTILVVTVAALVALAAAQVAALR